MRTSERNASNKQAREMVNIMSAEFDLPQKNIAQIHPSHKEEKFYTKQDIFLSRMGSILQLPQNALTQT